MTGINLRLVSNFLKAFVGLLTSFFDGTGVLLRIFLHTTTSLICLQLRASSLVGKLDAAPPHVRTLSTQRPI